jgi:hypothetical protein
MNELNDDDKPVVSTIINEANFRTQDGFNYEDEVH